jgi:hypothetical protein
MTTWNSSLLVSVSKKIFDRRYVSIAERNQHSLDAGGAVCAVGAASLADRPITWPGRKLISDIMDSDPFLVSFCMFAVNFSGDSTSKLLSKR